MRFSIPKGNLNVSKTIKVFPGIKLRWNMNGGARLVLGIPGLNYSIPIPGTKLKTLKEKVVELLPEGKEKVDDEAV